MILRTRLMAIVFFLLSVSPLWSQVAPATNSATDKETPAAIQAPHLEPVFADDFSKDTRADYKVTGDASWESDKLTLPQGASIERTINGASWVKLDLNLESPPLTAEQPTSELRVWFRLNGASNCFTRLQRQLEDGETVCSIALIETDEKDGRLIERVIRTIHCENAPEGLITIEYRNGLARLTVQNEVWFVAYFEKGSANVVSLWLQAASGRFELGNFSAAALSANEKEFTETEQQSLANVSASERDLIEMYRAGKYPAAAEIGERVLVIQKSVLGKQHPSYATSLNNLAVVYESMGNFVRAESLFKETLDIQRLVLGEQHPNYASTLSSLAMLHYVLGDFARAEPLIKQALEIEKLVYGEEHPDYASSLTVLAALYKNKGDFSNAESCYRQALEIAKSVLGENHSHYANSLNNLALLYDKMGKINSAESLLKQAIETQKSAVGEKHPNYAISLNNLAELYRRIDDPEHAESYYKQAIDIQKSALGENHQDYATSLNNLSLFYHSMGDFARAEPLCRQALEIRKAVLGEKHPNYANSLNNLALLYDDMGEFGRAETLYRQAIEIKKSVLGEDHPDYALSLNNLALFYGSMGDSARAEPLIKQAIEVVKLVYGEQHPDYANKLNTLALLSLSMGDSTRAELLFTQALDIRKSVFGETHSSSATSLINLAGLYDSIGAFTRAEPLYRQAMQVQLLHLNANALVQSARQQARNQALLRTYLDSRLANAVVRKSLAAESLEDLWQWKGAVTTRQQAYRQVAANPQVAPLFGDLQSVSRQLSAINGQRPLAPPETASEFAKAAFEQKHMVWNDRFATLSRQAEDLEQQIAAGSNLFRRIREPLTVAQVRRWLPAGTAFVDFLEYNHATPNAGQKGKIDYERRFIAFVVRRDKDPAMIGLGSASSIADAITAFRRPFQSEATTPDERKSAADAANQLRRDLWLPVEEHLDAIDTVIISPDTSLGTLPFAALPGKINGTYLLEDYRIAMIPMAGQLRELIERSPETPSSKGLLVVGDVDYDAPQRAPVSPASSAEPLLADSMLVRESNKLRNARKGQWASLSGFRAELEAVTQLYSSKYPDDPSLVLTGDIASEAEFLIEARRYKTLHVITHGYFEDPGTKSMAQVDIRQKMIMSDIKGPDPFFNTYVPGLLSGLAMAGANRPSQNPEDPRDGILYSTEIEASPLQGVDLVVLSACETGLGPVAGGEGLAGLQRAFQVAGARSVIASLWKVDDAATLALMTEFYTNLWVKKESKIDALRNAQLILLHQYDLKTDKLRRGLGTTPGKVATSEKSGSAPKSDKSRLDPAFWAAFQLSGDWR